MEINAKKDLFSFKFSPVYGMIVMVINMYGYIIGKVVKITPKYIICDNNGIGYLIIVPNPYNFILNQDYKIYVHQYVKEDVLDLYGFKEEDDKEMFLKLISVSGIGPKSALSILASATASEVANAIDSGNDAYLKKFPGIGSKASQQIILDLKGKLSFDSTIVTPNSKLDDVQDALIALGYSKKELTKVLAKLDANKEVGELVKDALKMMVK